MADFIHPYGITPMATEWNRVRNQAEFLNPYTNSGPVNDRGGDLWGLTADYAPLVDQDADLFYPWLDQIGKAGNRALMPVFHNRMDGTESAEPAFAQIQAPWREVGATGWNAVNLLEFPRVVDRTLEVYGNGTSAGGNYIFRTFTVIPGAYYQVTLDIPQQTAPVQLYLYDNGTAIAGPGGANAYGRRSYIVSLSTANLVVSLSSSVFMPTYYGDLQISRVMTVETAAAAGSPEIITLGGLNGALNNFRAGQFVNIQTSAGFELKRIGRTIRQIGGVTVNGINVNHVGRMLVEPAPRNSVAVNAGIIHHNPVCRMRLAQGPIGARISAPLRHGFRLQFLEDPTS